MEYDFQEIEKKWQKRWRARGSYKVEEVQGKEKFYVLDMFPYPSGAGLHVGHPLGYIASDIIARYKRHQGYNVLHPMGYDSFGLPAEQYAIETGQHPAITTENNIARYRQQLDQIGFCYDWDREVRTSEPSYYKWTQWIFSELFESWYNLDTDRAEPISSLEEKFTTNGTYNVNAAIDEHWWKLLTKEEFPFFSEHFSGEFTATDWKSLTDRQKQLILMHFRLTYLADSWVNWCPKLGTVLANDEVKDGRSERGGHPVEQKLMRQWSMRITAYADRLLRGLDTIDWSDSIKEIQRNWIGRSEGASIVFQVDSSDATIEVFTTRPDTVFGVAFVTLAPEHGLVDAVTTPDQKGAVTAYVNATKLKTERDRQSEQKSTGVFTGGYAVHPLTGKRIPIWIGDYVLASYGTGAVMAVPAGDQRDWDFAKTYNIAFTNIFEGVSVDESAHTEKTTPLRESSFLDGTCGKKATQLVVAKLEELGAGKGKVNFRLRDAVFSRQRYWGEPFPIFYKDGLPYVVDGQQVTLPDVDKYLPTEDGQPPLARAKKEDWNVFLGDHMEFNTMPGWAGSSWYFLRYMDPKNDQTFCAKDKAAYWGQVDLYMGGAEHATGHLLYSRFWTKFLFDRGYIAFDEPFKKMVNQGMILGRSNFVYRVIIDVKKVDESISDKEEWAASKEMEGFKRMDWAMRMNDTINSYCVSKEYVSDIEGSYVLSEDVYLKINQDLEKYNLALRSINRSLCISQIIRPNIDISFVDNDVLDVDSFKEKKIQFKNSKFIPGPDGKFRCSNEVEKMSKSKYNVQTPDELVERYGADTLRCYEMFLGPLEQHKPWDTKGITGVHGFLRKLWRLMHDQDNNLRVTDEAASADELKALHKTIRKVTEDLDRLSWNTVVSAMMIGVNELTDLKSSKRSILQPLVVLLSPYAPHLAEELWERLQGEGSVMDQMWPKWEEQYLVEANFTYPVSFNGKVRFKVDLPADMNAAEVEKAVMDNEKTPQYLEGKAPKKVIVVQGRIVNIVH
ncbi:MAG: leucine--tRNA ligase [Cryomorphaceae bacterium]|nr:leucine--tRNA ligase [Cryomorphaceae bacterium]